MAMPKRGRLLRFFFAVLGALVVAIAGFVLWLWWPDANKLSVYAAQGDLTGIRWSIRLGVDPNEPSRWGWYHENLGQTALTTAAATGQVAAVRLLIAEGADPDLLDADGRSQTPLSTAAMHGQLEVCRELLKAGADPNIPTTPHERRAPGGWTALDWALQAEHKEVADLLRKHGAVEGRRRLRKDIDD
ncbi:MAG: ankyrin repeat domain-containing protein [Pirellulales bacterium]